MNFSLINNLINYYSIVFREDGTFIISNVPSGSYIIEVVNPNYLYEPVRVEINSKGKFRARKVNLIQTSQVIQVPYPLKMRSLGPFRYFQVREEWRLTDFIFNPMVRIISFKSYTSKQISQINLAFLPGLYDGFANDPNYDSSKNNERS